MRADALGFSHKLFAVSINGSPASSCLSHISIMSVDIIATLQILIKLGSEIKTRLNSLDQAAEDLQLLTTNLKLLLSVFQNPIGEDVIKSHLSEFVNILDILQSIAQLCMKCAKVLDIDLDGATTTPDKTEARGKKFVKRIRAFNKIPDLLAEVQRKAEQLQKIYTAISTVLIHDIRAQQGMTNGKDVVTATGSPNTSASPGTLVNLAISTELPNIDQLVGNLLKECKHLRQRLQEAIVLPDTSIVEEYQAQNPEGVSFWRERFQKEEISLSMLRYETVYVSWARFVHETEKSFVLSQIPTAVLHTGNIDVVREQGTRYTIDHTGTRCLPTIRPLWLPALRAYLDPLHRGYVKPQDYFNLLQGCSFSMTLRRLALEAAGYGTLVECERESADLPMPAAIESPLDHIGWTSAQIVSVPTADQLGIFTEREIIDSNNDTFFSCFSNATPDVYVHVRYLQTGQIERKNLSRRVRPFGNICIGAALSIQYELQAGSHAWSHDLHITEFRACFGGQYIITASGGSENIVFSTRLLKTSFEKLLSDDDKIADSSLPEFNCTLLGSSKVFINPPKIGEKIQIEHDGFWYDSRVTAIDDDEIEYTDWDSTLEDRSTSNMPTEYNGEENGEDNDGYFFFSEDQLRQIGKGTRRLWRPWRKNTSRYNVRPYRCFHVGDTVEAPVVYPDFRYNYHDIDNSQLYLPARIINVKGDQYEVEFSPALSVHSWWPGRMPKGEDLGAGPGMRVKNPFSFTRVLVGMDRVRPFYRGPRPVLGLQTINPHGWSSFQGIYLHALEELLSKTL
ncbi:hypothetical protein V8C26DRAFT_414763 [Trichoderma gracile]